jgi:hypothetical protein
LWGTTISVDDPHHGICEPLYMCEPLSESKNIHDSEFHRLLARFLLVES